MVFHLYAIGLSRLGAVEAARSEPICLSEVLGPQGCVRIAIPEPVDRAHRNIRRIESRLSEVNPRDKVDGLLYRPKGMRQTTLSVCGESSTATRMS